MTRWHLLLFHAANGAVAISGLVYAWMRYLLDPVDEWAVVNHPWQPQLQHLHVLVAPLLVFAVGAIWSSHAVAKLRNGAGQRKAGTGLAVLFLPMAASGYLLQVAADPEWRQRWVWLHVASSVLWLTALAVHQIRAWSSRRREAQSGTEASAAAMISSQPAERLSVSSPLSGSVRQRSQ